MNLKLKALVYMLGFIGAGIAGGLLVNTVAVFLGPETTVNVLIGSVLAFLLYQVYGLVLARLETEAKIDELSKK
jgi:Flp pilus assembly protein protease CpaA